MDKVYSLGELKQTLSPVFLRFGVRRAILFGSYAKGLATNHSDVDILVDSGLQGLAFFGLLDEVNNSLSTSVDLIDISQIEKNSEIDREIRESGVTIFE